jgi:hypothetical protein
MYPQFAIYIVRVRLYSKIMGYTKRKCDNCGKEYMADNRNLKRGWGLCCSKRCAAKKREKSRPDYDPVYNSLKRDGLLPRKTDYVETYNNSGWADDDETYNNSGWAEDDQWGDCDLGIHD